MDTLGSLGCLVSLVLFPVHLNACTGTDRGVGGWNRCEQRDGGECNRSN